MLQKRHFYFYFFFPLFLLLLLGISGGVALARANAPTQIPLFDTPTPIWGTTTPTWEPLFKTPTPQPTLALGCPGGLPVGWGTVTPDVFWSAQCGPCLLTLTPYSTSTPYPLPSAIVGLTQTAEAFFGTSTPTGIPTGTYCAVPTATAIGPTPESPSLTCGFSFFATCIQITDTEVQLTIDRDSPMGTSFFSHAPYTQPVQITIIGEYTHTATSGFEISLDDAFYLSDYNGSVIDSLQHWCVSSAGHSVGCSATIARTFTLPADLFSGTFKIVIADSPQPGIQDHVTANFRIYLGATCTDFGTPTPTVTPVGIATGLYCSAVSGSFSSSADSKLSDLPSILIGPPSCVSFGPYTIGLSSLNWLPGLDGISNVVMPGIEICFRGITFGSVTVFGIPINLDLLSTVITGAFTMRWIFRS